jgi:hypothetical protein
VYARQPLVACRNWCTKYVCITGHASPCRYLTSTCRWNGPEALVADEPPTEAMFLAGFVRDFLRIVGGFANVTGSMPAATARFDVIAFEELGELRQLPAATHEVVQDRER